VESVTGQSNSEWLKFMFGATLFLHKELVLPQSPILRTWTRSTHPTRPWNFHTFSAVVHSQEWSRN
jgi:hypothetical protein